MFHFVLKDLHGNGLRGYLSGFRVPFLCLYMKGHKADLVKEDFPFLRDLKMAD